MEASLDGFYEWYENNKKSLLKDAEKNKQKKLEMQKDFLKEWPIDKLSKMTIDEYVVGKGRENKSFCYELENGKYASFCLGIKGGSAGKFGIYYSRDEQAYCNQSNVVIPNNEVDERFNKLRNDLVEIVTKGLECQFDDNAFDERETTNSFFGKSAMIIKLLCGYSKESIYSGFNNRSYQKEVWGKLVPKEENGGVYRQNYEITKIISDRYKELDGNLLSTILWKYHNLVIKKDVDTGDSKLPGYKNKYSNILIESKNIVFHGAPGTGKSYLAKEIAADIVSDGSIEKYSELSKDEKSQIEFVQFHPSYDYTDFVEGLRPVMLNGTMTFKLEPGIFSKFISKARTNYEDSSKSKSELSKEKTAQELINKFFADVEFETQSFRTFRGTVFYITGVDEDSINVSIPDNQKSNLLSLNMSELRKMLESDTNFEQVKDVTSFFGKINATQNYSYDLALFKEIKGNYKIHDEKSKDDIDVKRKPFIFIIDEINRGEISKIFGELFFSIDPGYRGEEGAVSTQYSNLHKEEEYKFYIPDNVYIIGTMNDIDRSVDSFDFAMRRRFRFINIGANDRIEMLDGLPDEDRAIKRMNALNNAIDHVSELNSDYKIGAAYFLKLKNINYKELWSDYLAPLLQDYVRGLYSEKDLMEKFKDAYFLKDGGDDETSNN